MKPKYEISVWDDIYDSELQRFVEQKIIIIGSDTMTSEARAREPKLVENINGTNKFTFNMYYSYIDTRTGERVKNPYIKYLINERKIKVLWKNKWYDLLIKQIKEDQVQHLFSYICEDAYITELSRTGFDLTFATELENNIGTAQELVEKVIENTDWRFDKDGSQSIYQETEEPVYETITILPGVTDGIAAKCNPENSTIYIKPSMPILIYYSCAPDINNLKNEVQFYYNGTTQWEQDENDMLVINGNCCTINITRWNINNNVATAIVGNSTPFFRIDFGNGVSKRYRAKRYVQSQKTVYNNIVERYVNVYNGGELLGYNTTEFNDALSVVNLFTNPSNFKNTSGWIGEGITWRLCPGFDSTTQVSEYKTTSYLYLPGGQKIFNTGIQNNRPYIPNGFIKGEKYILRFKIKSDISSEDTPYINKSNAIEPSVRGRDPETYIPNDIYYFLSEYKQPSEDEPFDGWLEYTMTCVESCPYDMILSATHPFGLFLDVHGTGYWLEEIQFYKEIYGENGEGEEVRIDPGQMNIQSVTTQYWKYFDANQPDGTTKDSLIYRHISIGEWSDAIPVYNDFQRYGTIEDDNSNRFNILQDIAESFECWVRFEIEHDNKGQILYDEDGIPKKWVRIRQDTGQKTGIGFIYGIDLKGVIRNIKSDKISTKTIVEQNENEFGKNGFCSIARSTWNYPQENFIYNFDYYIQHGLLDKDTLYDDLYNVEGYYPQLHSLNSEYAKNLELLLNKKTELTKQNATMIVYGQYISSITDEIDSINDSLMKLAGVNSIGEAEDYAQSHLDDTKVQSLLNDKAQLKNTLTVYNNLQFQLLLSIEALTDYIEQKTIRQNIIIENLTELNRKFYIKYSRFIQEGTWTSENYWNDDLYYLDALQVAYQSSRPQLSYEINVLRLSDIQEYSSKIFNLGDISFIQDTEYFGYKDDKITPYKEAVVLTEITSFFETPDKDTIKVQNYKNQFDDLFQRITATVQNLEFTQGKYARAANIVTSDGTIRSSVIQNTFNTNKDLVYGAQNESATIDNTGITVTDNANATKQVKITSGGVFVTNDAGDTWKNAIRGDGISTDLLTAGKINTEEITVYNGKHPSFRWDPNGLNAYKFTDEGVVDTTQFVRFDQYGIYGRKNAPEVWNPKTEDEIYNESSFGLTWTKFFMKSQNGNKKIEISTERDIIVNDGNTDRIIIGRVDGIDNDNYGIRINRWNTEAKPPQPETIFECSDRGSTIAGWTITKDSLQSRLDPSNPTNIQIRADGNIGCYGHPSLNYEEQAYLSKVIPNSVTVLNLKTNQSATLYKDANIYLYVSQIGSRQVSYLKEQTTTALQAWDERYKPTSTSEVAITTKITSNGKDKYNYYKLSNVTVGYTRVSYNYTKINEYKRLNSDGKTFETVYVYNYTGYFNFTVYYTLNNTRYTLCGIDSSNTYNMKFYIPAADTQWSIDKDGRAIFHDILADRGTIAGWYINGERIYQTYDGTSNLTRRVNGQTVSNIKQQLSTVGSNNNPLDYTLITDAINSAIASIAGMTFKNGMIDGYSLASLFQMIQNTQDTAQNAYSMANEAKTTVDKLKNHHHTTRVIAYGGVAYGNVEAHSHSPVINDNYSTSGPI